MTEVGETNLRMGTPDFVCRSKSLVNLHNGSVHGDLLDNLTGDIHIILGQK